MLIVGLIICAISILSIPHTLIAFIFSVTGKWFFVSVVIAGIADIALTVYAILMIILKSC